jgi:hypothetical protein
MTTPARPLYRALDMLTNDYAPTIKGREPFWRPRAAPVTDQVRVPAWDWTNPALDPDADLVTLDVNAAYLAALSSATFAHGALIHDDTPHGQAPGFYLVDVHAWQDHRMPSPLGLQPVDAERVWIAHPTLDVLQALSESEYGYWPDVRIYDAWTSPTSCRLRKWTSEVRDDRREAVRARNAAKLADDHDAYAEADADYEAIKLGYSQAVQLMRGPQEGEKTKSSVHRPDWYATIHAQHAANMWRRAWNCVQVGHGPAWMGATDAIRWTADDLRAIHVRCAPMLKMDQTGESIGTLKIRRPDADPS